MLFVHEIFGFIAGMDSAEDEEQYAYDFLRFAMKNPKAMPLLAVR